MNVFAKPAPLVALGAAIVFGLLGQPLIAIVAVIAWIGILAFASIRKTGETRASDPTEGMDADSRALFVPIKRLTREIEEFVEKNPNSSLMRTVGDEARTEALRIREQIARALQVRGELKRALRGRSTASADVQELQEKANAALSEAERSALESAAEARQIELGHYGTVESAIARIDAGVRQAEAALSEIRARLAVAASGETAQQADQSDDLRETLVRLKALSLSVDEAEQMLKSR